MRSIGVPAALPTDDPARQMLADSTVRHAEAALRHVDSGGEYAGEHWLASRSPYTCFPNREQTEAMGTCRWNTPAAQRNNPSMKTIICLSLSPRHVALGPLSELYAAYKPVTKNKPNILVILTDVPRARRLHCVRIRTQRIFARRTSTAYAARG